MLLVFLVRVLVTAFFLHDRVVSPVHNQGGMPLTAFWEAALNFGKGSLAFVVTSTSCKTADSDFGPPRVFDFPGTYHIWWAFPYPPPGEALDGRSETPHEFL